MISFAAFSFIDLQFRRSKTSLKPMNLCPAYFVQVEPPHSSTRIHGADMIVSNRRCHLRSRVAIAIVWVQQRARTRVAGPGRTRSIPDQDPPLSLLSTPERAWPSRRSNGRHSQCIQIHLTQAPPISQGCNKRIQSTAQPSKHHIRQAAIHSGRVAWVAGR